ncbi:MAG: hypothetical protein HC852_09975 [Acaryochloridaceae cyanobacterium RU_4_10]|nr:hypothetical protein [Acaryochloridaceae cyanobacterium RU_4_10]
MDGRLLGIVRHQPCPKHILVYSPKGLVCSEPDPTSLTVTLRTSLHQHVARHLHLPPALGCLKFVGPKLKLGVGDRKTIADH